jgi:hypothetical protein
MVPGHKGAGALDYIAIAYLELNKKLEAKNAPEMLFLHIQNMKV